MENNIEFSCTIDTTDKSAELAMEIWLDDVQIFHDNHVSGLTVFKHDIIDDEGDHELRFILKGKNPSHTTVDELGQIVSDARLVINDVMFAEIKLGNLFSDLATYTHDFNGTGQMVQEKCYGEIGCNGTVSIKFSTPIYIWLLENM
jgi:hypothetical protein